MNGSSRQLDRNLTSNNAQSRGPPATRHVLSGSSGEGAETYHNARVSHSSRKKDNLKIRIMLHGDGATPVFIAKLPA